jgi:hypothetical protein
MSSKKRLSSSSDDSRALTSVDSFLRRVEQTSRGDLERSSSGSTNSLLFALDATASREGTWDLACQVQHEMFEAVGEAGELALQLAFYRGYHELRASKWVIDSRELHRLMSAVRCRSGATQIQRMLDHAYDVSNERPLRTVVFVGDSVEEPIEGILGAAGKLAIKGVPVLMFLEGDDGHAEAAFRKVADITHGAFARFDLSSPARLRELLMAAAVFAVSGAEGLARLKDGIESDLREFAGLIEGPGRSR